LHHLALGGKRFDEPNEVCLTENLGTLKTLVLQHRDYDFEDEKVKKNLEEVWSPHLADQNMPPKISFVSKAEFGRREDQEKVSKLLYTMETYTNLEISPKKSPRPPRTTEI
jgi:hypothetical protein